MNGWDIATAIGTVGAVVVALILGLLEQQRMGRRHQDELSRLEDERTRAEADRDKAVDRAAREVREQQARRVALWTESDLSYRDSHSVFKDARIEEEMLMATDTLVVHNYSDMPIIRILIAAVRDGQIIDAQSLMTLPPGGEYRKTLPSVEIGMEIDSNACYMIFRDAHGRFWTRYSNGDLEEVPVGGQGQQSMDTRLAR